MRLILSTDTTKTLALSAELTRLLPPRRLQLALKKFGLYLVLAIISVVIPVLHFILVPLFLILAFVVPVKVYRKEFCLTLLKPEGCLECAKPLKEVVYLDEALRVKCPHCATNYLLQA